MSVGEWSMCLMVSSRAIMIVITQQNFQFQYAVQFNFLGIKLILSKK
jgi:hypothetical protein